MNHHSILLTVASGFPMLGHFHIIPARSCWRHANVVLLVIFLVGADAKGCKSQASIVKDWKTTDSYAGS